MQPDIFYLDVLVSVVARIGRAEQASSDEGLW